MGYRVGIDTGGTFTDVVAIDETTGVLHVTKTPSTPSDPSSALVQGIRKVSRAGGFAVEDVDVVAHGTTTATNAVLQRHFDRIGLVVTRGFRHVLEIARQSVPDGYGNSYFWVKPPRIVPADYVKTVGGRLDFEGNELRPFDEEQAVAAARWFKDRGITTIGVCFLHSYAGDEHELRMREILRREHPDAVVSISSEVLREYREYERSMTTLVDAAVKPNVSRYVTNIHTRLDDFTGATEGGRERIPFYIMKSNGGVLSADEVVHQPITTVLSGPAAGALGAGLIAKKAGFDKVLTCDGGGTSTDVSVVLAGEPTLTTEGTVGAYPSKIPMIDVVTVGAGGGSIAWISPEGTLKVGPQSAGADPGPLCYAKGGTEPTITDAHVVLGRIPPHLLGGEIPLDTEAAKAGIEAIAVKLGIDPDRCATGILEISAWNQANALRQVSVKRGLDVRDFMLATFGGSGSLLACRLVDILDLAGVVVPPNPGNVSAFGLLTVDVKNDYVQTHVAKESALDHAAVQSILDDLTDRAREALDKEGFAAAEHRFLELDRGFRPQEKDQARNELAEAEEQQRKMYYDYKRAQELRGVGISEAGLLHHFGSKAGLLTATLEERDRRDLVRRTEDEAAGADLPRPSATRSGATPRRPASCPCTSWSPPRRRTPPTRPTTSCATATAPCATRTTRASRTPSCAARGRAGRAVARPISPSAPSSRSPATRSR